MCPIIPDEHLQAIAENENLSAQTRDAASSHLSRRVVFPLSKQAISEAVVPPPSTNNTGFTWSTYSMNNEEPGRLKLPGEPVADSKGHHIAQNDTAHDRCIKAFEWTWKLFHDKFKRNSLDRKGFELRATIHFGHNSGDAHWDAIAKQVFLGDGGSYDAERTTSPMSPYSIDVIAHELTHGLVSMEVPGLEVKLQEKSVFPEWKTDTDVDPIFKEALKALPNDAEGRKLGIRFLQSTWIAGRKQEAQTLNEHIADCFGIMVKHFSNNDTAQSGNWQMAPGWWSDDTMASKKYSGNFLRTFELPKSATEPDQFPKKWDTDTNFLAEPGMIDNHYYAGIGNHAFYTAAQKFGGKTWENVGQIWYGALTDPEFKKPINQTYKFWRSLTIKYAEKQFQADGAKKMTEAWQAVGL